MLVRDWWRGAVIYQIYPRSFADSNGDGIGDLAGITARLGHVADLGVDAVWPQPDLSLANEGYGVTMSRTIGTSSRCSARSPTLTRWSRKRTASGSSSSSTRFSHTARTCIRSFRKAGNRGPAKYADWYVWVDPRPDGTAPNNWLSVFGGIAWEWEPRRHQYYLHQFSSRSRRTSTTTTRKCRTIIWKR